VPHAASLRIRPTGKGVTYDVRYRLDGAQKTLAFPNNETQARDFLGIVRQHGPEFALSWVKRDVGPSTPTVAEYAETYIASKSGVEGKTLDHYRMFMRRSIGPWMGHLPLNMVTPETIAGWINEQTAPTREVDGKLPRPLGAKTIKNRHGFLYAMFQHAVQRGVVDRNPCEGSNMPSSESREMTFLSGDEYTRLLSYIPPYWQPLVQTLAGTGMRWSEATALKPGDFDLEAGVVRVSRAWKDSQAKGRYLGAPKTTRSKRTISLPPGLIALLRPLVEQRGELVFTNRHGNAILQQTFHKEVWAPARNLANGRPAFDIAKDHNPHWAPNRGGYEWHAEPAAVGERIHKEPRIHDLRHTHASWLINGGTPLPVIQRRLGHESITTTVDRYGHLSPDNLTAAAMAVQVAMAGALPEIEG
jgi:integrase